MSNCMCSPTKNRDYYWKDYTGVVPEDALPVGRDIDDNSIYAGQVYGGQHGLLLGIIFPGKTEVEYAYSGYNKTDTAIKILCSRNKENFTWLRTSSENFHLDTIDKHPVIGGYYAHQKKFYNIGRITLNGQTIVGILDSFFTIGTTAFYFIHDKEQKGNIKTFEVLIYQPQLCESCLNIQVNPRLGEESSVEPN